MADTPLPEVLIDGVVDNFLTNVETALEPWYSLEAAKLEATFLETCQTIFNHNSTDAQDLEVVIVGSLTTVVSKHCQSLPSLMTDSPYHPFTYPFNTRNLSFRPTHAL